MKQGVDYYRSQNTEIMNRKHYIYAEDEDGNPIEMEDVYKANNKLPSGFFKLLVDQKINYLLGNPLTFDVDPDDEELEDTLPRTFQKKLKKAGKEASKKAVGWLQAYIDQEGEFGIKQIPSEQIIPVYKVDNQDELELIIRYYKVRALNEDNQVVKVNRVEVWDDETVTYYQENTEDSLYHLLDEQEMKQIFGQPYSNPKYHFQEELRFGDAVEEVEGMGWGRIPFVPIYNNDEGDYDLQPVKRFIDAYDIVNSDFINNLEDFQDVYWILKGYDGENLNEFLQQVKRYKSLKVAEDGDARAETIDIPHEARKEAKEGLRRDIFKFGQGFDPDKVGDGNVTNVVIKSRFASLDLKADQFEDEIKETIKKLVYFVNEYREQQGEQPIELNKINFDRAMMINEVELLEANAQQKGNVSEDTRLANHPWVNDQEEEQAKMDEDREDVVNLDDIGIEDLADGDEEGEE